MDTEFEGTHWRKAITPARDRMQSRLIAWVGGVFLGALTMHSLVFALPLLERFPSFVFGAFGISIAFALVAWGLRAATPAGAAFGGMICLLLTFWLGSFVDSRLRSGLTPLILLFVLTFVATRLGKQRKTKAGLAEGARGRNAAQVIANLGVAGLGSSWVGAAVLIWFTRGAVRSPEAPLIIVGTVVLAALAEATADTVSSEIGQAFGGVPVMLTTMQRVEAGTDGAVTVLGTLAGVMAGAFVAFAGQWALRLPLKQAATALVGGVAGFFFDSLLGATAERRGWMGNDLVNFTSTLVAAMTALLLMVVLA